VLAVVSNSRPQPRRLRPEMTALTVYRVVDGKIARLMLLL
jgi:hypothetical protein